MGWWIHPVEGDDEKGGQGLAAARVTSATPACQLYSVHSSMRVGLCCTPAECIVI